MRRSTKAFKSQVENRNYLQSANFRLTFNNLPRVSFYCNECTIPGLEVPPAMQSAMPNPIPQPGTNVVFEDFIIDFFVDEDMTNYFELLYWIIGLGFPDSLSQIYNFQCFRGAGNDQANGAINLFSDASLLILNSNYNVNYSVKFKEIFPYKISALNLNSKLETTEPITVTAYFKYMLFDFVTNKNQEILDKPIE
jgi:hypothetical protein